MWLFLLSASCFWRMYLATFLPMCAGAVIGFASQIHFSALYNGVAGAMAFGSVGFLIGTLWQFWQPERRRQIRWGVFAYTCVLLGGSSVVGIVIVAPQMLREASTLAYIKSLSGRDLKYVDIRDGCNSDNPRRLVDSTELEALAQALRDVKGLNGFPRDIQQRRYFCLTLVASDRTLRLECQYEDENEGPAVCGRVLRSGMVTQYGCHMMSLGLRKWFEEHCEARGSAQAQQTTLAR